MININDVMLIIKRTNYMCFNHRTHMQKNGGIFGIFKEDHLHKNLRMDHHVTIYLQNGYLKSKTQKFVNPFGFYQDEQNNNNEGFV